MEWEAQEFSAWLAEGFGTVRQPSLRGPVGTPLHSTSAENKSHLLMNILSETHSLFYFNGALTGEPIAQQVIRVGEASRKQATVHEAAGITRRSTARRARIRHPAAPPQYSG